MTQLPGDMVASRTGSAHQFCVAKISHIRIQHHIADTEGFLDGGFNVHGMIPYDSGFMKDPAPTQLVDHSLSDEDKLVTQTPGAISTLAIIL